MEQTKRRRVRGIVPKAERKEITTRMLPEMAEVVREVAAERGISVNDLIVEAVQADLVRGPHGDERLMKLARARARQALLAAVDELLPQEEAAISA